MPYTSKLKFYALLLLGFLIGALVVGAITLTITTSFTTSSTNDLAQTIKDCTEPGGECYQRAQQQRHEQIFDINQVSVYAAYCAQKKNDQSLLQIQKCIIHQLEKDSNKKKMEHFTR